MTQRRSIYSLRAISQGVFNLHMDRHLQKPVRNQCMNGTIHWRPTIECCRCASYDGRGLGKSFCQCLCDERKKHSNGKSRELHFMNLISEMGSLDDIFVHFSPSYLYQVWNATGIISYAVIRVLNFINIFISCLTFPEQSLHNSRSGLLVFDVDWKFSIQKKCFMNPKNRICP